MKKGYLFSIFLAVIFGLTTLFMLSYIKNQNEEVQYYKATFFIETDELMAGYEKLLDFETDFLDQDDNDRKRVMLQTHAELLKSAKQQSSTARGLLYEQVDPDDFVILETRVLEELLLFQKAADDIERKEHRNALDEALTELKEFIRNGMKKNDLCMGDNCNNK